MTYSRFLSVGDIILDPFALNFCLDMTCCLARSPHLAIFPLHLQVYLQAICSDKTLDQSHLVKEELVWPHGLRVLCSGREATVTMSSWWRVCPQDAEMLLALSLLPHFYPRQNFSSWKSPTFRVDYPFASRPFRKHPHRHTQGCVHGDPKPSKD